MVGVYQANKTQNSRQLNILFAVLILLIFLSIRLQHILVYGAPGIGTIYQEQEAWVLWVRVFNGALIFLSLLTLHNYFFERNWEKGEWASAENKRITSRERSVNFFTN